MATPLQTVPVDENNWSAELMIEADGSVTKYASFADVTISDYVPPPAETVAEPGT